MRCHFHPENKATHTDSIVDLEHCSEHEIGYKRVAICLSCAIERKAVNTSRVEELAVTCEQGHN